MLGNFYSLQSFLLLSKIWQNYQISLQAFLSDIMLIRWTEVRRSWSTGVLPIFRFLSLMPIAVVCLRRKGLISSGIFIQSSLIAFRITQLYFSDRNYYTIFSKCFEYLWIEPWFLEWWIIKRCRRQGERCDFAYLDNLGSNLWIQL